MKYLPAMTRTRGFLMTDREQTKVQRRHDFIPAEQYLRERPLCASLLDMATSHVLRSKRLTRSMADFSAGYYSARVRSCFS